MDCAILIRFFISLRIIEIENLTRNCANLVADTLAIDLAQRRTDQYNEEEFYTFNAAPHRMRPVRMFASWLTFKKTPDGNGRVVYSAVRSRVETARQIDGAVFGIDGGRTGTHAMRSGRASAIVAAWYDVEVIRRLGEFYIISPKCTCGRINMRCLQADKDWFRR